MTSDLGLPKSHPPFGANNFAKSTNPALISQRRLDALHESGLLDSPAEEIFDSATRLVSRLLNAPVGLVSLVTPKRQFFKSQNGLAKSLGEARETPLSHSLCQHVVASNAPLVINDARIDPLARESLAIEDLGVLAYLGVPLLSPNGEVLGAFCAIDTSPRAWSRGDVATMLDIAEMLSREIALRMTNHSVRQSATPAAQLQD